jgi:FkbM family methyltransferase
MIVRCHVELPGKSCAFDIELNDAIAQDRNIYIYLNNNQFPEPELMRVLLRAIRPGDFVIDCGACSGFFSLVMAALGANVMAIEPGTNNLPSLYRNIEINQFSIDVHPVALGGQHGKRDFLLIDDGGANSFTQPADRQPGEKISVDVRPLRDIAGGNPRLIKMDIEGAEYEVLKSWMGGPWTCPFIVIELNLEALARMGHLGHQIKDLMRDHGYEMFILFADDTLPLWLPPGIDLKCTRQNTDVLFCRPDDLRQLWPEVQI